MPIIVQIAHSNYRNKYTIAHWLSNEGKSSAEFMKQLEQILETSLLAQLSLEERIYRAIELQLAQSNIDQYPEVWEMLNGVKEVLEKHYERLNVALDQAAIRRADLLRTEQAYLLVDGLGKSNGGKSRIRQEQVSQMLHDDYAELNLAAIGNTLLHTTALAANSQEVAIIALEHLGNLSQFVVKISELLPKVAAQELLAQFPEVQKTVGDLAARNTRGAWRSPKDGVS